MKRARLDGLVAVAILVLLGFGIVMPLLASETGQGDSQPQPQPEVTAKLEALASHIIIGEVKKVSSQEDERGVIHTKVEVSVGSILKGQLSSSKIVVGYEGGRMGDKGMTVYYERPYDGGFIGTKSPEFCEGERVMLYLKGGDSAFQLVYDDLGKVTLGGPMLAILLP